MSLSKNKGFTIVELLVVISIIGLLSSIVLSSLQAARAKTRDSRRIQDLSQARTALFLYQDDFGDWMQTGSGCGYAGNGNGWFNLASGTYPMAMSQCLVNGGYIPSEIIDPTGGKSGSNPTNAVYTYMKYTTGVGTYLFAKLETRPQSGTVTDGTSCPSCDTNYGMNYFLKVN